MPTFSRAPIEGVLPLTPFALTAEQKVDYEAIHSNIEYLESKRVDGFIQFGSMGQLYAPSEEEFNQVCDVCVEAADDATVVVASSAPNTSEAIRRARYAEAAGADGTMLALPYALPLTEELAVEFYQDVDRAIDGDIAIMVYNYPPLSGVNITAEMWREELLNIDAIKAVKESNYNSPHHFDVITTIADQVNFFPGNDNQYWIDSHLDAHGLIGILAWVAPEATVRYFEACQQGNQDDEWTREAYQRFLDAWATINRLPDIPMEGYEAAILNALVEIGGGQAGPPRKPYKPLPPEGRDTLERAVKPLIELEQNL